MLVLGCGLGVFDGGGVAGFGLSDEDDSGDVASFDVFGRDNDRSDE